MQIPSFTHTVTYTIAYAQFIPATSRPYLDIERMAPQLQDQIDSLQHEIKDMQKKIDKAEALLEKETNSDEISYLRQTLIQLRQDKDRLQEKELILLRPSAPAGELFEIIHVRTHHHYHSSKNCNHQLDWL